MSGILQENLSPQIYKKLRKKYWRWRDSSQIVAGKDQIVLPEINLESDSIDRQSINVFTGGPGDKVFYLVERLQEFYAFPSVIHYVLSNICNLRCVMCPYHSETARSHRKSSFFNHPTYTKIEHFRRVAQEAGRYGIVFALVSWKRRFSIKISSNLLASLGKPEFPTFTSLPTACFSPPKRVNACSMPG